MVEVNQVSLLWEVKCETSYLEEAGFREETDYTGALDWSSLRHPPRDGSTGWIPGMLLNILKCIGPS